MEEPKKFPLYDDFGKASEVLLTNPDLLFTHTIVSNGYDKWAIMRIDEWAEFFADRFERNLGLKS
jgi:hypothetical protein